MEKIFIGWSGNQSLANALGEKINAKGVNQAIVGGGRPTDMYIGAQVINQINDCDLAILLVEKKKDEISPNLMFEWGYLVAKLSVKYIYTVLINMPVNELPSDVLGSWVFEEKFDRESTTEQALAERIYEKFEKAFGQDREMDYFDVIDDWKNRFFGVRHPEKITERELCEYIVFGCLAAYYYGDNGELKDAVKGLVCSDELQDVVHFAKAYIDVFLDSGNMRNPLNDEQMYNSREAFETVLSRKRKLTPKLDAVIDILSYDAYGLACSLYLKNTDLSEEERAYFENLSKTNLETVLARLLDFENSYQDNRSVVTLLKAYIYNDLAQLHRQKEGEKEIYLQYLEKSVEARRGIYQIVKSHYPHNSFLIEKMEQEYMIAFCAYCKHLKDPFEKKINKKKIEKRLADWKEDYSAFGSLVQRLEFNLSQIDG